MNIPDQVFRDVSFRMSYKNCYFSDTIYDYFITMFGAMFYRAMPYIYALLCILEVASNIYLARTVAETWITDENATITTSTTTTAISTTTSSTFLPDGISLLHVIAFGIALIGSFVPIFTGLILILSVPFCCCCLLVAGLRRPFLRFVSLSCLCPCYIPRPKLRFTVRIGFHTVCMSLRIAAVILYGLLYLNASSIEEREIIYLFLLITAVSLIFPLLTILLDIYHYRVWWAYQPDIDVSPEILKTPFSRKHKRFIPYVLTGNFRTTTFGNRQCKYGNFCQEQELEHVIIFHSSEYQPQPRWTSDQPIYIGFHRTTPESALLIAKSEFRPSKKGMLGPGAYFARSTSATLSKIGKPDQTGAWFVAEIVMGTVYQVEQDLIRRQDNNPYYEPALHQYVANGNWSHDCDTCYFKHTDESKDEFCIKDPATQIRRWILVIEDPYDRKLFLYGLHEELSSSLCGCI